VDRSIQRLGHVDLLYLHQTTIEALEDQRYMAVFKGLKDENYGGIKFLGASIGHDVDILREALAKNLLDDFDVVQMDDRVYKQAGDLIDQLVKKNIEIVINTVGRTENKKEKRDFRGAYQVFARDSRVSLILLGTFNQSHLKDNVQAINDAAMAASYKRPAEFNSSEETLESIFGEINEKFDGEQTLVIGITGQLGTGKTYFAKRLIGDLRKKLQAKLNEKNKHVIKVALEDLLIPRAERGDVKTHADMFDQEMVMRVQQALVEGKIVYKYLFDSNLRTRRRVDGSHIQRLKGVSAQETNENGRTLIYDGQLTGQMRREGRISPVSEIFVDITIPKDEYDLIERLDPKGHVIIHEGTMSGFNEEAASRYVVMLKMTADKNTRDENIKLRVFYGTQYADSTDPLSTIMQHSENIDGMAEGLYKRAQRQATMTFDNSRPVLSPKQILGIARRKRNILKWNYRNKRIPENMYLLIIKYLDAVIAGGISDIENAVPITAVEENIGVHVNTVFNNTILHLIIEGEDEQSFSAQARNILKGSIHSYLSTPEIKTVRFTKEGKKTESPHIVQKPWGMEVWAAENEVFGVKFIYIVQGEHESVQVHKRKVESQLYFGPGDVLHIDQEEFDHLKEEAGLGDNPTPEQIKSFVAGLPFVKVEGDNLAIRSMSPGVVHTSRPTEGLILHLEFNAGEEAASATVTTRLIDKYSDQERAEAGRVDNNWWGPRLPIVLGSKSERLNFAASGRKVNQMPIVEENGVSRIEETSGYVVDHLRFETNQSKTIVANTRTTEVLIVLDGKFKVVKDGEEYTFEAGEVFELPMREAVTLTALSESQLIYARAPPIDPISTLVKKAQEKKEALLFVAPQTPLVVEASIKAAQELKRPLVFIPSRNQVDHDNFGAGYVLGWNQQRFIEYVRKRLIELKAQDVVVYFYRDHSGPWQRDEEYAKAIPAQEAMAHAKLSLLADLQAGFTAFHIDASRSPFPHEWNHVQQGKASEELILERTVELIEYIEKQRKVLGISPVNYEVRGERKSWNASSAQIIDNFLTNIKTALERKGLDGDVIDFVTINPVPLRERGSAQAIMDEPIIQKLTDIVKKHGFQVKFHNGDFMSQEDRQKLPELGVHAVNIAPELAMVQTLTLLALADEESRLFQGSAGQNGERKPSNFRNILTEAVLKLERWKKWIPLVKGWTESEVRADPDKLKKVIEFNGHYAYNEPEVEEAHRRLAGNIKQFRGEDYWFSSTRDVLRRVITEMYISLSSSNLKKDIDEAMEGDGIGDKAMVGDGTLDFRKIFIGPGDQRIDERDERTKQEYREFMRAQKQQSQLLRRSDPVLEEMMARRQPRSEISKPIDVVAKLRETGLPLSTNGYREYLDQEKAAVPERIIRDGYVYLFRGDYLGRENRGIFSLMYLIYHMTLDQFLNKRIESGPPIQNDPLYGYRPDTLMEEIMSKHTAVGQQFLIGVSTSFDVASAFPQRDLEERIDHVVYVLKVPVERVFFNYVRPEVSHKEEEEFLVPDYVTTEEIVDIFPADELNGKGFTIKDYLAGKMAELSIAEQLEDEAMLGFTRLKETLSKRFSKKPSQGRYTIIGLNGRSISINTVSADYDNLKFRLGEQDFLLNVTREIIQTLIPEEKQPRSRKITIELLAATNLSRVFLFSWGKTKYIIKVAAEQYANAYIENQWRILGQIHQNGEIENVAKALHYGQKSISHSSGQEEDLAFLITDYFPGIGLLDYSILPAYAISRSSPVRFKRQTLKAVNIILSLARLVDKIHKQGVIIRELKPENVIVLQGGQVALFDFNVSMMTDYDWESDPLRLKITIPHEFADDGLDFLTRPQERKKPDIQSDIFTLGMDLSFILTRADSYQLQDDQLNAIIEKATAPRGERYRTVQGFIDDLETYQFEKTVVMGADSEDGEVRDEAMVGDEGDTAMVGDDISDAAMLGEGDEAMGKVFKKVYLEETDPDQKIQALQSWFLADPLSLIQWLKEETAEIIKVLGFSQDDMDRVEGFQEKIKQRLFHYSVAVINIERIFKDPQTIQFLNFNLPQFWDIYEEIYQLNEWLQEAFPSKGRILHPRFAWVLRENGQLKETIASKLNDSSSRFRRAIDQYIGPIRADEAIRKILSTFDHVPRHLYLPQYQQNVVLKDEPLPIGYGQTISQPSLIATVLTLLELSKEDKVLEVGAGSGWLAALMADQAGEVYASEIVPQLAKRAQRTIEKIGFKNQYRCV